MQQITISGTLLNDAETCIDKKGNSYVRFDVTCGESEMNGRKSFTHYHCICYIGGFNELKKGESVFLTGKLNAKISTDKEGKAYLNLNVMVYQASGGYKVIDK